MAHVCDGCGETFETLTRLRLHEKDDCQGQETFDEIDPEADDVGTQGVEGLLTCRNCDRPNPNAAVEETADYDGEDYHLIVEFGCHFCGFDNENRLVMTGVDAADLSDLPPHLQPDSVGGAA
ncbi:hypothetical protein [Halobellus rufus]|uniref:hypothetical protein n=1 Tax=Halobellus rufus TaxID=1448860 RepID=UPI0006797056|nr:hypothetical protein [Halobellus rufus]